MYRTPRTHSPWYRHASSRHPYLGLSALTTMMTLATYRGGGECVLEGGMRGASGRLLLPPANLHSNNAPAPHRTFGPRHRATKRTPLSGLWQHLLVFVFGPQDDMSDVVTEHPPPPDDHVSDPRLTEHLSPILVAPASHTPNHFEFVVTAPTPPACYSTSGSRASSATSRRWTPNETPLGSSVTSAGGSATSGVVGFDTNLTIKPTPNGALRRAASDRPQYLSPARHPRHKPRHKTITDVTEEARKVLEQLILRNEADALHGLPAMTAAASSQLSQSEGTSAQSSDPARNPLSARGLSTSAVAEDELDGRTHRVVQDGASRLLPPAAPDLQRDSVAMPDDDATSHSPVSGPNSLYSFSSRSSSNRNRIHQLTHVTDETQLKMAAAQEQQRKRKKKRKTQSRPVRHGSTSSSSSSEYEIIDGQLRLRPKKSIFKRAKDRLRQSFRWKKSPRSVHSFDPYSIDDDEIREAEAQTAPKTRDTNTMPGSGPSKRSFRLSFRPQRSSTKSRSSVDRSPSGGGADRGFLSDVPPCTQHGRCPLHDGPTRRLEENSIITLPRNAHSPPPGEKEKNRSFFDNVLRTLRKGGGKLRRKGSTKEPVGPPPRSRSADALSHHATTSGSLLRPPTGRTATITGSRTRKAASQDEGTLRAVLYCRCVSAEVAGSHVTRPRPPPLPALRPPGDEADEHFANNTTTTADRRQLHLSGMAINAPRVTLHAGGDVTVAPDDMGVTSYGVPCVGPAAADEAEGMDEVDSKSPNGQGPVVHTPFAQKTEAEKDELFERIAEQLAAIADNYNLESPRSLKNPDLFFKAPRTQTRTTTVPKSASAPLPPPTVTTPPTTAPPPTQSRRCASLTVPDPAAVAASGGGEGSEAAGAEGGARGGGRTPIEQKIGRILRDKGDRAAGDLADFQPVVSELVKNASYSQFQQIIHENVGSEPGWQQVALVFNLTRSAVQLAGLGTAAALQIKELTLRYFEDRFAGWIIGQGGWESMVEDTDLSSEVD